MLAIKIVLFIYLLVPIVYLITCVLDKVFVKKLKNYKTKKYDDIYVLLPALKEQKIVKDTIDHFRNITYKGKIKYIIITSEKEDNEYRVKKIKEDTTSVVVDEYLKEIKDNRFIHYHYPEINGNKSSQMNYAIEKIKKLSKNWNKTYISAFDFDSRPAGSTFNDLNKVVQNKNHPEAVQQIPLEISNYKEISHNSIIMIMYSLQHLVRNIVIEKFKLQLYSLFNINVSKYLMGACVHLRLDTLIDNGLFPYFVDDLTLGYRYSIKGYRFEYLITQNVCLIPKNIKGYMSSYTLIFKGILTFWDEVKRNKGYFLGKLGVIFFGILNLLEFTVIPFVFLFYYIYSIVTMNFNIIFILSVLMPMIWSISSYLLIKYYGIKKENKIKTLIAIVFSPVWFIFRPGGCFRYLYNLIKSKLSRKEMTYTKTER